MKFFLITIITLLLTFLLNPVLKKINKKKPIKPFNLHIHHSVLGALLLILGTVVGNAIIAAIGLGIYAGHAAEEIYFNKRGLIRAFFIFVTH